MSRISSLAVLQTRMVLELPGCPEMLRVQALQEAFQEFCRESEAWREELAPIDIVEDQLEYDLIPEFDAMILRLEWVKLNTEDGVTEGLEPDPLAVELYTLTPGDPEVLTLDDGLEPTEAITDALTVKAILIPEFNSLDISEWMLNLHYRTLVAGALDIRLRDANKRWTNPARAADYAMRFRDGIQTAKAEVTRDYKQGSSVLPM